MAHRRLRKSFCSSSFFNWAAGRGLVQANPVEGVKRLKEQRQPPRWLSRRELGAFMRAVQKYGGPKELALGAARGLARHPVEVRLTREDDRCVPLAARAALANGWGPECKLFCVNGNSPLKMVML